MASNNDSRIHFNKMDYEKELAEDIASLHTKESDLIYFAEPPIETSELSLVPEELQKLSRLKAYQSVPKGHQFIVKIVYDLVENLTLSHSPALSLGSKISGALDVDSDTGPLVARQFGQEDIAMKISQKHDSLSYRDAQNVAKEIKRLLNRRVSARLVELTAGTSHGTSSPPKKREYIAFEESTLNLTEEMRKTLEMTLNKSLNNLHLQDKKSNLKHKSSQTDQKKKKATKSRTVKISDSIDTVNNTSDESTSDSPTPKNKQTQTKPKEKQD